MEWRGPLNENDSEPSDGASGGRPCGAWCFTLMLCRWMGEADAPSTEDLRSLIWDEVLRYHPHLSTKGSARDSPKEAAPTRI